MSKPSTYKVATRLDQLLMPLKLGREFLPGVVFSSAEFQDAIHLGFKQGKNTHQFFLKPKDRSDEFLFKTKNFLLIYDGKNLDDNALSIAKNLALLIQTNEAKFTKVSYPDMAAALRIDIPVVTYGRTAEVRLLVRCNESCAFCHTNEQAENLAMDIPAYLKTIREFKSRQANLLVISGGEPTLLPNLADYIALAQKEGFQEIELQTNAVTLHQKGRVDALKNAGLSKLFISLHSSNAETLATITGHKRALEQTTQGIEACLAAGLPVTLNHVINALNLEELPNFPHFVQEKFAGQIQKIIFSVASPNFPTWKTSPLLSPPKEIGPKLSLALKNCEALGLSPFVPSLCGLPACLLEESVRHFHEDFQHAQKEDWMKWDRQFSEGCTDCAAHKTCTGYWQRLAHRFGEDWVNPIPNQP